MHFRKYFPYYAMMLPGIIYLIMFKYVPMMGSVIAFKDYSVFQGIWGSAWSGLENFKKLFEYPDFYRILRNTIVLGFIKTFLVFPIPLILALMLNELRNAKMKKAIQTIICIPYFISWVVVGGLVFDFFGVGGIFNNVREALGMDTLLVMQKESWFRPVYLISTIWKESGWGTVVYLAAISSIDPSLYESASIDGASRFQKMRYITFPLLVPTALILLLLNIGNFLTLGFDQVYNLYTPMTYSVADIFDTYVFRVGIQEAQYSFATAVGLFQSVVGLIMVVVFNKIANKVSEDGGLW
ncbi:ABC transporter permease [Lachnoclostridium sp. An169]|uniref:ABC transporter permease n=1 Tax=Lachnoclostridium sp. An169 TaxID=1965569 RepID=UPI001FA83B1E|nr:ABC transporter permease subunit [Lachnoclostridium sp. An169]